MRWLAILIFAAVCAGGGFLLAKHLTTAPSVRSDALHVGSPAPAFDLGGTDGRRYRLSDLAGQPVLLNFWATWCGPCRKEMPLLNQFYQQNRHRGLQVVGVALDDPQAVISYLEELGITYLNLVGSVDVMDMLRAYGNTSGALPYTVLLDSEGTVSWLKLGEVSAQELELALSKILPP